MKKCKACKSEIDPKATRCPKCGADQRIWFAKHPILTVILILIMFGMMGGIANSDKSGSTTSTKTGGNSQNNTTTQPTQQPAIVVDAKTLVGEFDKNKLSADEKYKGKLVQTTAYISNISGGDFGDYYLVLKPSSDQYYFGTNIQAFFKDKTALTSLSKEQKVTIQGTMGEMSIGQVIMKDCSIIK